MTTTTMDMNELSGLIQGIIIAENKKLKLEIDASMRAYVSPLFEKYDLKFQQLEADLLTTTSTADKALAASVTNEQNIAALKSRVDDQSIPPSVIEKFEQLEKKILDLEEELDDTRNRSMRGNLVFYGLEESESDDPRNRSTTKDIIANFMTDYLDAPSFESAKLHIVRAHRSAKNNRERTNPRPIFVKFDRDDTAERFLSASIRNKVTDEGYKVSQQFTKRLQARRNEAMQERRRMRDRGEIVSGFVDYPAVLKVKGPGETNYRKVKTY